MFANRKVKDKSLKPSDNDGVAYVVTYPAEKGLGHTALFALNKETQEFFHRSFYPDGWYRVFAHNMFRFPVGGLNIDTPEIDAKKEKSAPSSILKISGLSYQQMRKDHEKFLADIQTSHFFALGHNSHNPFNYAVRLVHAHINTETRGVEFDSELTRFPTSDDLITTILREGKNPVRFSNCAAAVETCLEEGGFEIKHHEHPVLNDFFKTQFSRMPATSMDAIAKSGGKEVIHKPHKLPKPLQDAIKRGQTYATSPQEPEDNQEAAIKRVTNLT
jgi:hypothetical protein